MRKPKRWQRERSLNLNPNPIAAAAAAAADDYKWYLGYIYNKNKN